MAPHATVSAREWEDGVLENGKVASLAETFREQGYVAATPKYSLEDSLFLRLVVALFSLLQIEILMRGSRYCTIGNVIPTRALDVLQARMDYDAAHQSVELKWEERGVRSGAGGHLQMGVPRMAPFVPQEIVANPIIEQLAVALLGEPREVFLAFFNGNTNIPGSGTQLLHTDGGWDIRNEEEAAAAAEPWPQPTANLVFNFSTDEIGPQNGPTELWPGTHMDPQFANDAISQRVEGISADQREAERRAVSPPVLNILPRGAVSVRDYRLWHRGTPNVDNRPRHMIALSYMRRTSYNEPAIGVKTHAGGGVDGRFLFGAECTAAFSRDWWPKPAIARHIGNEGRNIYINWNVEFAPPGVSVDHFGNTEGDFSGNDRGNYWLPKGPLDLPCSAGVHPWVIEAAARYQPSRL